MRRGKEKRKRGRVSQRLKVWKGKRGMKKERKKRRKMEWREKIKEGWRRGERMDIKGFQREGLNQGRKRMNGYIKKRG